MSEFSQACREKEIKFGYNFNTLAEVTHFFGLMAMMLPYHNWFYVPGEDDVRCMLLKEDGGRGWHNKRTFGKMMDNWGYYEIVQIDETNDNEEIARKHVEDELEKTQNIRYVFWRESRHGAMWYKFYGAFELDRVATLAEKELGRYVCIYKKVANSIRFDRDKVGAAAEEETWKRTMLEFMMKVRNLTQEEAEKELALSQEKIVKVEERENEDESHNFCFEGRKHINYAKEMTAEEFFSA